MTADDQYSLLNRDNLTQPIRTELSEKQKAFCEFFLTFSKSTLNLKHLQTKDDLHSWFNFPNYALRKTWLDICPKSLVSKDPLTGNMLNAFKHCCDLNHSIVTIFSDHFEGNWVGKSLFWSEAKPYKCLLTHWLLMTSILFLTDTI